jgi:hypothetical protein
MHLTGFYDMSSEMLKTVTRGSVAGSASIVMAELDPMGIRITPCRRSYVLRDGACFVMPVPGRDPGINPDIPTGTVEACSGCFGSAGAGGDGRVKPGHDGLFSRHGVILMPMGLDPAIYRGSVPVQMDGSSQAMMIGQVFGRLVSGATIRGMRGNGGGSVVVSIARYVTATPGSAIECGNCGAGMDGTGPAMTPGGLGRARDDRTPSLR